MKGSIRLYVLFLGTIILSLSTDKLACGLDLKNKDTTVYNRMICEDEKLQIGCKEPDKVLNIQRAYYGRYSITPCNKNHIQYTMGCTANNTLDVLKELCQNKATCDIYATNSVFGNPCRNSTNVLEVIYNCYDQTEKTEQYALDEETTISPKIEVTSTSTNEVEEVFVLPDILPVSPEYISEKVTQKQGYDQVKCYFAENSNISRHFNFGSDRAATANQHISIPCSTDIEEQTGTMLFQCGIDGQFIFINSTCVFIKNKWIDSYQKQLDSQSENPTVIIQKINEDLKSEKSHDLLRSDKSLEKVVNLIHDLSVNVQEKNPKPNMISKETLVHTADTLIEKNLEWKRVPKEDRSKSATKLVDVIENIIFQKKENQLTEVQSFSIKTKNIIAEVGSNEELQKEMTFPSNIDFSNEKVVVNLENPEKSQQFMFVVYKNVNELFTSDDDLVNKSMPPTHLDNKNIIINSNIISFKMNQKKDEDFLKKVPVELTFQHIKQDDAYVQYEIKPVCSYWNYDKTTYDGGFWSSDGCQVKSTNKTHTVCQCNHLTHFAILMDVYGVHEELSEVHEVILTAITIVCSLISCISIILTLLAFRFLKIIKKNREQSTTKDLTTITTHLCLCLLFSLSLFLAGIMAQKLRLKIFCSSIALLSHYFFLCSFFWMLLEGVQLYFMLVRIFIVDKSPIKRFCLLAYGLPFLIVVGSKFADHYQFDSLGYGTSNHCWISTYRGFNLTFIVPVSLILAANFIMLIIVVYGMRNAMALRQTKVSRKQEDFLKSLFGFWCIILTLLGTPWILGYLMLDTKTTLIFTYLFTIVNASQGTIVFVFHCLVSKNVRDEILKIYRKRKNQLFSSKESGKTSSLLLKSKSLHRGPNSSSSFKTPKKFFDSARLIDRKGSNCSSNQTNSSTDNSQKRLTRSNRRHGNSIFDYLYQIFCSCFLSHDSCTPQVYQFNQNVKNSHSFSTNSRHFNDTTQSPLRNYTTVTAQNNSFSKTINDEDCITLLQNEPCFNCQNVLCNQSLNKQIISNTMCSEKPTLLQMYLTNEASKNLYNQKYLYGNLRNSNNQQQGSIPLASKMNRTSSHLSTCSNSSNNPTQATYLSPISSTYLNNKNFVYLNNCANCQKSNCQIPNMPPPPLPPFNTTNLNQYCGVNVQPSNASMLRNKDSFLSNKYNGDRFNSARTMEKQNFRLPPVPARKENSLSVKALHHDENQYLQPECNSYSMVDSEFQSESQYYCDDRICDVEENSNMYSEVFEDYMEEPSLSIDLGSKQFSGKNKSNKLKSNLIYKGKLKDLIAMPEEFDKDESVEHSHISDQDLFNMTNTILRNNLKKQNGLNNLVETKEEHTADDDLSELHTDTNNASSSFRPASSVLNGVFKTADLYALPETWKKGENVK